MSAPATPLTEEAVLRLLQTDPLAAADLLEADGRRSLEYARMLREWAAGGRGWKDTGGMKDAARLRVVGHDGAVRQEVEVK